MTKSPDGIFLNRIMEKCNANLLHCKRKKRRGGGVFFKTPTPPKIKQPNTKNPRDQNTRRFFTQPNF